MSLNKIFINNSDTNYTHSIFDITQHTGISYENLNAALAAVPDGKKSGGMTIRYVQSSDNEYVQYRFTLSTFTAGQFATIGYWQGIDKEPSFDSMNLVESGGTYSKCIGEIYSVTGVGNGSSSLATTGTIKVKGSSKYGIKLPYIVLGSEFVDWGDSNTYIKIQFLTSAGGTSSQSDIIYNYLARKNGLAPSYIEVDTNADVGRIRFQFYGNTNESYEFNLIEVSNTLNYLSQKIDNNKFDKKNVG